MRLLRPHLVLVLALLFGPAPAWAAEQRLALVVGIGAYTHLPALRNSVGDARLVADKLRADGFAVDFQSDPTRDGLNKAVRAFGRRIAEAGGDAVALFYYAGHGVQDDKQANYLIGADADVQSQVDLPLEALRLDGVLGTIEAGKPRISFAVIDACRDNPLPASSSRGGTRGLAVEAERRGLLIAFSTEPGKTADDGPAGQNSPFAAAFAQELQVPGLEAATLFRNVSRRVLDSTNQVQFPWITQRLTDDFFFRPGAAPQPTADMADKPASSAAAEPALDAADSGEVDYGQAVMVNTAQDYQEWLARHPDHPRRKSVLALLQRLNEQRLWDAAEAAATPAGKRDALERLRVAFPDGVYAEKAATELDAMAGMPPPRAPAATAAPPPMIAGRVTGLDPHGDNFLALKAAPDIGSPRLTTMGPDTPVTVLGHAGPWTHVRLANGQTGWAFGRYLTEAPARDASPTSPDDHMPLALVSWHDAHAVHVYSDRLHQYVFFYCRGTTRRRLMAYQLPLIDDARNDGASLEAIARRDTFLATRADGQDVSIQPTRKYVRSYLDQGEMKTEVVLQVNEADWAVLRAATRIYTAGRQTDLNRAVANRLTVPLAGDHGLFDRIDDDCMQ